MPKTNSIPEPSSPRKPRTVAAPLESPDKINMNEHFFNAQCLSCGEPASQSNIEKNSQVYYAHF
jgi:DNA polymerase zeta